MPESLACNFTKKETLAQVFSCEFCEIAKNTFFTEHLWAAVSKQFPQTKQIHSSLSHLLKSWSSSSLQWTAVSKLIRHCCAFTPRTDGLWLWRTVMLVCRNIQVATITIDWIRLWRGKSADFFAPYIKGKIYYHRIRLKLKYISCRTFSW